MQKVKFRLHYAVIASLFALGAAQAQTKPPAAAPTPSGHEQQWEYIVVSYGKTVFETPEKTLGYRSLGLSGGSEATDLEANLDIMGRFGWEVATIVGTIGGDQQIVLKRKYDKVRSANEYGMISKGRTLYLKDLADIIERSNKLAEESLRQSEAERNKPRLNDLDARDALAARQIKMAAIEASYTAALKKFAFGNNATISVKPKSIYSSDIEVTINVDLTADFLIDGNSYRRKSVANFLKARLTEYRFKDSNMGKYEGIRIIINGFIKFNGEDVKVGSENTSLSILDRWD